MMNLSPKSDLDRNSTQLHVKLKSLKLDLATTDRVMTVTIMLVIADLILEETEVLCWRLIVMFNLGDRGARPERARRTQGEERALQDLSLFLTEAPVNYL